MERSQRPTRTRGHGPTAWRTDGSGKVGVAARTVVAEAEVSLPLPNRGVKRSNGLSGFPSSSSVGWTSIVVSRQQLGGGSSIEEAKEEGHHLPSQGTHPRTDDGTQEQGSARHKD